MQRSGKAVFGQKQSKHILILAKDDKIRHMVIKPWILALTGCFISVMLIGYLLATTYLVIRDDLIGSSIARQARMQHTYEDRIAQLRTKLDRATSQQLLNQQLVQDKVAELMQKQAKLSLRHGQLSPILDRAGLTRTQMDNIPIPGPMRGGRQDSASIQATGTDNSNYLTAFSGTSASSMFGADPLTTSSVSPELTAKTFSAKDTNNLFGNVALSLENMEHEQINRMQVLAQNTNQKLAEINRILKSSKLPAPHLTSDQNAVGGPFIMPQAGDDAFNYSLRGLDEALQNLDRVLHHVENLPLTYPISGAPISSRFGTRRDPFFGRKAFHSGIDFKARTGTSIHAGAKGRVIHAGWKGGYGKAVEIDHGNGIISRYGHMSRILVKKGQFVTVDTRIGLVGSTGRSTGPHLHYEIRRNGKAVNPAPFLNVGLKLRPLLKTL